MRLDADIFCTQMPLSLNVLAPKYLTSKCCGPNYSKLKCYGKNKQSAFEGFKFTADIAIKKILQGIVTCNAHLHKKTIETMNKK